MRRSPNLLKSYLGTIVAGAAAIAFLVASAASVGANAATDGPGEAITSARETITKVHVLSYKAGVRSEGSVAAQSPAIVADVSAARAEAGGWRVSAKGTLTTADGKATEFHVGYDGATAWAVHEAAKAVVQKSVSSMAELETFFREESVQAAVPWVMLADSPLAFTNAEIVSDDPADVAGQPCTTVRITTKSTLPEESASHTRLFLAKADGLPRRIDRVRETRARKEGEAPDRTIQTLELADLKTDKEAVVGAYIAPTIDGYTIKTASSRPKRERRDRDDPLRGPDVRDKDGMLAVGMVAPEWNLKDSKGTEHKLSDYRGKVVFMDFWATWCPPCRASMPSVQRLHEKYKGKDVVVLGMNFGEKKAEAGPAYMKEKGFTYLNIVNAEKLAPTYKVSGIPAFFLVGKDGRILYKGSGFPMGDKKAEQAHEAKMMKLIDDALEGKLDVKTPEDKKEGGDGEKKNEGTQDK